MINKVLVNDTVADIEYLNYLEQVVPSTETNLSANAYMDYYKAAQHASDRGELVILVPDPVVQAIKKEDRKNQPQLNVRVEYSLEAPCGGAHFICRNSSYPERTNRTLLIVFTLTPFPHPSRYAYK